MSTAAPSQGYWTTAATNFKTKYLDAGTKDTRVAKFFASAKTRDVVVKQWATGAELISEIVDLTGASASTKRGLHTMTSSFKDARTVFGLMNVMENAIPSIYQHIVKIATYVSAVYHKKPILLEKKKGGEPEKIDEAGETTFVVLGELGRFVSTLAFTTGFGICRPILFTDKHFKHAVSENARTLGQQFGLVMLLCHLSTVFSTLCDVIRDGLIYVRKGRATDDLFNLLDSLAKHTITLIEKAFEIGASVITVFRIKAPAGVRLTLAFAAATVGVYKAWRETAA